MRAFATLAFCALAGCGVNEAAFIEDRAQARCSWSVECYPGVYGSVDECVTDWGDDTDGLTCVFDSAAAKDCVKALREADCPTGGAVPTYPEACSAVYTDCEGES